MWLWFLSHQRALGKLFMISPCHHTTSVKNIIAKHCFPIIKMDAVGALRTAPHRISLAKWQVASGEANVVSGSGVNRTKHGWAPTFREGWKTMRDVWWGKESTCITTRTIYEALTMGRILGQVFYTRYVIHSHKRELIQVVGGLKMKHLGVGVF